MAIDPFPSKRNDPTWDDFTTAHTAAPVADRQVADRQVADPFTGRPRPVLPEIDVAAMVRLVEQTQKVQSAITEPPKTKLPVWSKGEHAKTAYWSVIIPTLVTGCANLAVHEWGPLGPTVTGGLVAALAAALGISGLNHHWDSKAPAIMLGVTLGATSFAMAAGSGGWMDVVAWLVGGTATLGYKIVWNRKHAADKAKVALTEAKVRTETLKGNAVQTGSSIKDAINLLKLQEAQRAATAAVAPVAICATQEEAALRRAVWDLFGETLLDCDVRFTRTGWVATLGLPLSLARQDARNAWHKVSNALRLDGRLKVADGRLTNELVVSFVSNDAAALDPITGWYPGASWAVVADTGEEVSVPLGRRILFAGTSGSGKSWSARPLMAEASEYEDHRLILIDLKVTEARNWQHRARIAFEPRHVHDVMEELVQEGERRLKMIPRGRDTVEIGPDLPRITVFVDEGGELISSVGEDVMDRLRTVARKYRAAEIILVWCTQKPSLTGSGHGLDSQISAQLTHKLCLAVSTPSESRVVFGEDAGEKGWDAHELPMPGWALLRDIESQSEPARLRMRAMSPKHVIALPDRPVWTIDGDRHYSGDSQYLSLVEAAEASPQDMVTSYLDANPGASQREVAAALGLSKTAVQRIAKTL